MSAAQLPPMAENRFPVLDVWRAASILLVLACHLLPLGPHVLGLNDLAGAAGMAIFFTLSGFLITSALIHSPVVSAFVVRRLARILPLAWTYLLVVLVVRHQGPEVWARNLLFIANWPPMTLAPLADHFWSLCVELQFYLGAALLVLVAPRRWPFLLVGLGLAVTLNRVVNGVPIAINTYYRLDEILAGSLLALLVSRRSRALHALSRAPLLIPVLLVFLVSCHAQAGALNYLRPYLAMLAVGITVCRASCAANPSRLVRAMFYIAAISYALYVLHPLVDATWLGAGDKLVKYAKRPLMLLVLFALAHLSTFYFERPAIAWSKRWIRRRNANGTAPAQG